MKKVQLPLFLRRLRAAIVIATIFFATAQSPSLRPLLLNPHGNLSLLWEIWTSSLIIPYDEISLSMLFDFGFFNIFLTPIASFVYAFLSKKYFVRFIIFSIFIGTTTFITTAHFFPAYPISLFSGLALAICIFWFLLLSETNTCLFMMLPISKKWSFIGTIVLCSFFPVLNHEWAHLMQVWSMGIAAYFYGIMGWSLNSGLQFLTPFEEFVQNRIKKVRRQFSWYILGPIRRIIHAL